MTIDNTLSLLLLLYVKMCMFAVLTIVVIIIIIISIDHPHKLVVDDPRTLITRWAVPAVKWIVDGLFLFCYFMLSSPFFLLLTNVVQNHQCILIG